MLDSPSAALPSNVRHAADCRAPNAVRGSGLYGANHVASGNIPRLLSGNSEPSAADVDRLVLA